MSDHLSLLPDVDPDDIDPRVDRLARLFAADSLDASWMSRTHGGPAAIGHDIDGELVWTPTIGRAL